MWIRDVLALTLLAACGLFIVFFIKPQRALLMAAIVAIGYLVRYGTTPQLVTLLCVVGVGVIGYTLLRSVIRDRPKRTLR